jgi:hypothetical protein
MKDGDITSTGSAMGDEGAAICIVDWTYIGPDEYDEDAVTNE